MEEEVIIISIKQFYKQQQNLPQFNVNHSKKLACSKTAYGKIYPVLERGPISLIIKDLHREKSKSLLWPKVKYDTWQNTHRDNFALYSTMKSRF